MCIRDRHYYLGDIFVLVSPELEEGVLLELKGRGCRQFESYLLAQERSWYEFFMDVLMAVSYTHLDVYKRQPHIRIIKFDPLWA